MSAAGGGRTPSQKIKLHDKMKVLKLLCRHFKLANEGLRLSVDDEILARLQAGRERARARSRATPRSQGDTRFLGKGVPENWDC